MDEQKFIGRKQELEQIRSLFEGDKQAAFFIRGEGGLGKTSLLQQAQAQALKLDSISGRKRREIKIALVQEFTRSEWSHEFNTGVDMMASELGADISKSDAQFSPERMVLDLDRAVDSNPDVIIMSLGSFPDLRPGLERAIQAGIKVITFDNELDRIEGLVARVGQEDFTGALQLAEKMAEDLNYEGEIAVMAAAQHVRQEYRTRALESIQRKYSGLQLLSPYGVMGPNAEVSACEATTKLLKEHPGVRAIWATFNEFARGAVRAVLDAGRTDVWVYGFDLCPTDRTLMSQPNSPWRATAAIDATEAGRLVVRLAVLSAYDSENELRRYYPLPLKVITQANLSAQAERRELAEMGWTLWLRSLQAAIRDKRRSQLVIGPILDFDDRTLLITENLEVRLARFMGETHTRDYVRKFEQLTELQAVSDAGIEQLHTARERVRQALVNALISFTEGRRLILFFDTVEKLPPSNRQHLLSLLKEVGNVVCLFAGRGQEKNDFGDLLKETFGPAACIHNFQPFSMEDSRDYLQEKQRQLGVNLDSPLAEKLLVWAEGRPIIIDLAVEYTARLISLEDIPYLSSSGQQVLSPEQKRDFEKRLVGLILKLEHMEPLFLAMSRVYPLDVRYIAYLLGWTEAEATVLYAEAKEYVFVKELPGELGIALHDEMRRMIGDYIWPDLDRNRDRQCRDSRLAVGYLTRQIAVTEQHRQLTHAQGAKATDVLTEQDATEREWWSLREQLVFHSLYANPSEGAQVFVDAFDEASRAHKLEVREGLVRQVDELEVLGVLRLEPAADFNIHRRCARHWIDEREYLRARGMVEILLNRELSPGQRLDALTLISNLYIRSGDLPLADQRLKDSWKLCETEPSLGRWKENVLNSLGQLHLNMGRIGQAAKEYEQALELASSDQRYEQTAVALMNIGYVAAIEGRYHDAEDYCQKARDLWQRAGRRRELGMSYSALGEVYRYWGRYREALEQYEAALEIFQPENDQLWLMRLYSYRGAVLRLQNKLDDAQKYLEVALQYDIPTEVPWALHVLGCVWRDRGQVEKAVQSFEKSDERAKAVHDMRSQMNNLVALTELEYEEWQGAKKLEHRQALHVSIENRCKQIQDILLAGYGFYHHAARARHVLANLLFDENEMDSALVEYGDVYSSLAQRTGGYGRYTFTDEFRQLESRIRKLPRPQALQWCQTLENKWRVEKEQGKLQRQELLSKIATLRIDIALTPSPSGDSHA